jgi:cell wall-associated NlpC family hydrolase
MAAKTILISGICLLFISGCASMSKSECASANWETRGSLDGQNGSPLSLLSSHAKACAKIGVSPNAELYRKGHANGVRLYCTPQNGLAEGRQNAQYNDVCPTDLEAPFLSSFVDGLELSLYKAEREKASAESRLYRLRLEQAAHDGPAPDKLVKRLENQENEVSRYSSEELRLKLRISELRLKIDANR